MAYLGKEDPDEDDPTRFLGPPRPNVLQQREALVERGDVAGIYNAILTSPWHETKHSDAFAQVFRAIDVASRNNPAHLSAELVRMMVNMAGYLTLRAQYTLLRRIQDRDGHTHDQPPDILTDVLEQFQGQIASMQAHVAELCQSQAATARLWQLARQKQRENDDREAERGQKRLPSKEKTAPKSNGSLNGHHPPVRGNGHTSNRVAALLGDGGKQH